MIRTKLTEMLGIEYPIVQGCMQWISRAPLVAAVSEAGGLGLLSSSTFSSADELQAEIRKIKSMTSKPFAVNLTLMPSLVVPDYAGYIRVCAEEGVKVMETAGRPPKDDMVRAIKDAGMVLIHKCTTVKHALKAQSLGADMVVADGFECAGHPGENDLGTMVLTPRCVEALDIPVICAGGVSTGRQMAAALMLGAEGVYMGTRFLLSEECPVLPAVKTTSSSTPTRWRRSCFCARSRTPRACIRAKSPSASLPRSRPAANSRMWPRTWPARRPARCSSRTRTWKTAASSAAARRPA